MYRTLVSCSGIICFTVLAGMPASSYAQELISAAAETDKPDSPALTEDTDTKEVDTEDRGWTLFGSDHEGYKGGRGLITLEGVSGMFLNPTSGTLPGGSLTMQYCAAILDKNKSTEIQHTTMASYGVTDWLEIGALGRVTDRPHDATIGGGGPLARVRLFKETTWLPEVSVGGMLREGNERIDKRTAFAAASKHWAFEENPLLVSLRGHVGFRQIWQNSDVNEANGSIVYGGAELEFPYGLFMTGEVSNRDDVFEHYPFSMGVQWRPTPVVGLSFAAVQTGGEDRIGFYAGIGGSYQF